MSFFSIKDFTTGVAAKIRSVLVNTDENLPAHVIQDTAGNDIMGTRIEAKSTATDTTSVSFMQVFKQISASVQAIAASVAGTLTVATHAVTQSGTWNVTVNTALAAGANVIGGITAAASSFADGALVTLGAKADAKSTATDTTSVSVMQVLKQVSASVQALEAAINSDGSQAAASSTPVALPNDQWPGMVNNANMVSGCISTAMTGTTSTSLVAAPGASLRNYITNITVSNSHATVGTDIEIQDGSGGTVLYVIPASAVFGGASVSFPIPLRQPTTNTALFAKNVTTGSNTKVSASGFKAA